MKLWEKLAEQEYADVYADFLKDKKDEILCQWEHFAATGDCSPIKCQHCVFFDKCDGSQDDVNKIKNALNEEVVN